MNPKRPRRSKRKASPAKNTNRPKAVREFTAGGVVWRRHNGGVEILMIQDRLDRWTIPKGHVEPGERLEQTALREVTEETGLHDLSLGVKLDKLHFFYRKEGKLIFMTTHVYLMEAGADSDQVVPEDSEGIKDAKWFPYPEALQLIEYRDTERLFRLGLKQLGVPLEPRRKRNEEGNKS